MKTFLSILFALALGPAPIARAANLPFGGEVLAPSSRPEPVSRPEPAALQANWWHYFEVKGEELDRHVKATRERLSALAGELAGETANAARPLIEGLENNLDTLAQARAIPNPAPPPPLAYAKNYTISQLLGIVARLQSRQAELPAKRAEVASSEKAIRIAKQSVDTQLAAYLNMLPTDPDRVLRGLKIMAERSAVGVAEERLRVSKAALAAHEALVAQLADEKAVAATRLTARDADLGILNARIEQAQAILKQSQERVIEEQTTALSVAADKTQKTKVPYHQQRVVNSQVEEAIAMLRLMRLKAEHQLTLLLLDSPDVDADALRGQLADWAAELTDIRKEAMAWTSDSERERDRAAEGMSSGSTLSGGAVPLFSMLYGDRLALAQRTLVTLDRLGDAIRPVEVLTPLVEEELARREGGLRDWLVRSELTLRHVWELTTDWTSRSLLKIGDTPVTILGLLRVGLILFVAWWVSYWFRRVLTRLGEGREGITQSALYTIGRLSHYGLITLGFIIGLSSIGLDFTNFALVAGAIGIGIGFGLQSIVNNFVSGLILLFERTLKVGDFVELGSGVTGEVRAINVRSTVITTNDDVDIVVPNSKFINDNVINWTLLDAYRRIHIHFKVPYGTDPDLINQAALEAADRVPHTLRERPASVWLVGFADSCFDFELVVWITPEAVKRPGAVNAAYRREIALALRKYGIEIPVPQRDLRLRAGFRQSSEPLPVALQEKQGS